jgi:hypothetical protein
MEMAETRLLKDIKESGMRERKKKEDISENPANKRYITQPPDS